MEAINNRGHILQGCLRIYMMFRIFNEAQQLYLTALIIQGDR